MEQQHQLKRTLATPASIETVRRLLADGEHASRSAFTRTVCSHFGFVDPRGRHQTAGCVKALRELERAGHFTLPAVSESGRGKGKSARRMDEPVPPPQGVPELAGDVLGLSLVKVESLDQMRLWNEMMLCEHPQGAGPLVGRQIRYLVKSDHGWLGGLAFAAAALKLADRDRWIGWDDATRGEHLHRVVGMSRFLIRPSVRCHNLASRVLGMALRGFAVDFEAQYGYRPWLVESFVDTEHFLGTSYQAANWVCIGHSRGRGRQDTAHEAAKSVKAIYVYALEPQFRARMGVAEPAEVPALQPAEGLEGPQWTQQEFGGAGLGDLRLAQRLVDSASTLSAAPGRAFCALARGDEAMLKGYYRLIDKPDDSAVTMQSILEPHSARTLQRMKAHRTVLCIQDGTDLNYSTLVQCEGLGCIGTNQTGARSAGLHLHSTLAVTTEGVPLGVLSAHCEAPSAKSEHDDRAPTAIPIEEKKTFAWIQGLRECVSATAELPATQLVCVMDREADFFELFDEQRGRNKVELLVRAKFDRLTNGELNLFDTVRSSTVKGRMLVDVPRQSARPKKSKQKQRPGHAKRTARVQLRYCQVGLLAPKYLDLPPIRLWVVHVLETQPPANVAPLEWFLLTTLDIDSVEAAEQCLRWYCLRWRIEDWHRVLKSGCRVEALQHNTARRLERAIAINLVIAWRLMLMTLLGRECPELPAEVLFSDLEVEILQAVQKKTELEIHASNLARPYAS